MSLYEEARGVIAQQRSLDWHEVHHGRFTASEIHQLMGKPKSGEWTQTAITYIYKKAAELLTGQSIFITSQPTDWGIDHEPFALKAYEQMTGCAVEPCGFIPFGEYTGGSPDGINGEFVIDFKCPFNSINHVKYLQLTTGDELFSGWPEYWWQLQANMLFTNKRLAHFVSFDPQMKKHKLKILELQADKSKQNEMIERVERAAIMRDEIIRQIEVTAIPGGLKMNNKYINSQGVEKSIHRQ